MAIKLAIRTFGSRPSGFGFSMRLAQRPGNSIYHMIYEREVSPFGALNAARKLRHINHRCSCFLRDSFGRPAIQVRINNDCVHFVLAHLRNHLGEMRWGRWNPWLWFEEK